MLQDPKLSSFVSKIHDISVEDIKNFDEKLKNRDLHTIGNDVFNYNLSVVSGMYVMYKLSKIVRKNYLDHVNDMKHIYNDNLISFVDKFYIQINFRGYSLQRKCEANKIQ